MAQGDCYLYNQFRLDVLEKKHDLENDTIKVALVTSAYTPTIGDVYPCWGNSPTSPTGVDVSGYEVTPGGTYAAGGATCANPSVTITASPQVVEIDFDDPTTSPLSTSSPMATWDQNASNPTNARWGIVYNDTATNKECIGFLDLGADFNLSGGALTLNWGTPFATVT